MCLKTLHSKYVSENARDPLCKFTAVSTINDLVKLNLIFFFCWKNVLFICPLFSELLKLSTNNMKAFWLHKLFQIVNNYTAKDYFEKIQDKNPIVL